MISGQHGLHETLSQKQFLNKQIIMKCRFLSLSNDLAKRNGNDHGPLRAYMASTIRDLMSDRVSVVMWSYSWPWIKPDQTAAVQTAVVHGPQRSPRVSKLQQEKDSLKGKLKELICKWPEESPGSCKLFFKTLPHCSATTCPEAMKVQTPDPRSQSGLAPPPTTWAFVGW